MTPPSLLAKRYAGALLDLADEARAIDPITHDLGALESLLATSHDLQLVIMSPTLSRAAQKAAMCAVADKAGFHAISRQFLSVLAQNRRMKALPDILGAVRAELAQRRGELSAQVSVAQDLSDDQKSALAQKLSASTGKKVSLCVAVDPALIGGMVVNVGSMQIDSSVKTKLSRMRAALAGAANQNENE